MQLREHNEDGDEPVTRTAAYDNPDMDPEDGDFEIGINGYKGYIVAPLLPNGDSVRFTIPRSEVDEYIETRDEISPPPQPPESVDRDPHVKTPDGWSGGKAIHTGGNIWCRQWKASLPLEHNITGDEDVDEFDIEVIYQLPTTDGVSIGLYSSEDSAWIGEIGHVVFDENLHDDEAQIKAINVIRQINEGDYAHQLADVITSAQD